MNCQILFSGKNKKTVINLSSAELAYRAVNVNFEHSLGKFRKQQTKIVVLSVPENMVCHFMQLVFEGDKF